MKCIQVISSLIAIAVAAPLGVADGTVIENYKGMIQDSLNEKMSMTKPLATHVSGDGVRGRRTADVPMLSNPNDTVIAAEAISMVVTKYNSLIAGEDELHRHLQNIQCSARLDAFTACASVSCNACAAAGLNEIIDGFESGLLTCNSLGGGLCTDCNCGSCSDEREAFSFCFYDAILGVLGASCPALECDQSPGAGGSGASMNTGGAGMLIGTFLFWFLN